MDSWKQAIQEYSLSPDSIEQPKGSSINQNIGFKRIRRWSALRMALNFDELLQLSEWETLSPQHESTSRLSKIISEPSPASDSLSPEWGKELQWIEFLFPQSERCPHIDEHHWLAKWMANAYALIWVMHGRSSMKACPEEDDTVLLFGNHSHDVFIGK